ncbi:MAG: ATP:cob(I)alamin adenosyltransferase [Patescibacteria group bacterium]|nr:MAG: ATP:cob(I)alamin adenosyltransferase [Patescibacteria group bacterium]
MKIYTREGDSGFSSLIGSKKKITKSDSVFDLLGLCDEINALLGCILADNKKNAESALLETIQSDLFYIGAYIAGLKPSPQDKSEWEEKVSRMERKMDQYSAKLSAIKSFILPGGTRPASEIHLARARVRTLERGLVSYVNRGKGESLKFILPYINRLSDLLFIMARYVNKTAGKEERLWRYKK